MQVPARDWSPIAIGLMLVALALLVFAPGLRGGFLFDDYSNLVLEQGWRVASFGLDEWRTALHSGIASPAGRPLAIATFSLNHALTGMDPFWFKLTGLLIHAGNGLLVWLLCRRIFALLPTDVGAGRPGYFAATLVAAAWLLHPLQVSSVLYVVQRMELGAATGTLLVLLAYLRGRQAQLGGRRALPWWLAAVAALVLGLGFKESAALAPGFAFLLELLLFRFRRSNGRLSRGWAMAYALAFLGAALMFLRFVLPMVGADGLYAARDFGPAERLLTQLPVLVLYLQQCLLPLPDTLYFYYDNFPVSRSMLSPPTTLAAGILLLALLGIAATAWRRWPLVALGIGWFLVAHALTSNVIPLELVFEHRNYLALLGVLLALVTPLSALGRRLHRDARITATLIPVLALALLCALQSATWGDPMRLAWTLENRNPDSPRASYDLGKQLVEASGGDDASAAWSMARGQFEHAASLPGNSPLGVQGLILMDARSGRTLEADTWARFRRQLTARSLDPEAVNALHAVSNCRIGGRCRFDDRELLVTFFAVLKRNPGNGSVRTLYADFAWNVLGDKPLAIRVQREAVALAPSDVMARVALARFLLASGDRAQAAEGRALADALRDVNRVGVADTRLKNLDATLETTGDTTGEGSAPAQ